MLRDDIVSYTRTYLAKGYSIQSIKTTLLQAGYSINDINESVAAAYTPIKHRINIKPALLILLGLVVFALVFFTVRKNMTIPEAEFNLSMEKNTLLSDESLSFSYTISAAKQTEATLTFKIVDYTNKKLLQTQENITFKQDSRQIDIKLPENTPPGQYILQATLSYDSKEAKASFTFNVIPTKTAKELQPFIEINQIECIPDCNDQNLCTEDSCINGICQYKSITPCCGNMKCEPGETEACSDCKKQQTFTESMDAIIRQAATLAKQKPEAAKTACSELPTRELSDRCLSTIAGISFDPSACPLIYSDENRDLCYADVAIETKQFTLCNSIKNRWIKNSCTAFQRLESTVKT